MLGWDRKAAGATPAEPPQAQPTLLDLLRDTVVSIVLDTGAETFDDLTEGEFHDDDHDPPAS